MMKKFIALMVSLIMTINFLSFIEVEAASDYSTIKIGLNSLGTHTQMSIKVSGNYSVEGQELPLGNGNTYTIKVENGRITLKDGDKKIAESTSQIKLIEHKNSNINTLQLNGGRRYQGNITFRLSSGRIFAINEVYLEDYLKGVVPYEMSNGWPLEALKAQAVAARTYAVRNFGKHVSKGYNLTDTAACQVYRGYNSSYKNAANAVDHTKGQIIKYNGSIIDALYSSSNGGYMEAAHNVWSSSYSYLVSKQDPYDLSSINPSKSWTRTFTGNQIQSILKNKGYDVGTIQSVEARYTSGDPSGRVRSLVITGDKATKTFTKFSAYRILCVDDINRDLKSSLYIIEKQDDKYIFKGKGYGHGVGMSQYGARAMVESHGKKYTDVIKFYYPGTSIHTMKVSPPSLTDMPEPKPQPTPQPKPQPEPKPHTKGITTASVLNVRSGAGLNYKIVGKLKKGTNVEILSTNGKWHRIKYGTLIGYVHTDYVKVEGQSTPPANTDPGTSKPQPPKDALPPQKEHGRVTAKTSLNVRNEASIRATRVGRLLSGETVEIVGYKNGWYKIKKGSLTGYVSADYLKKIDLSGDNDSGNKVERYGKVISKLNLNVRASASTSAKRIGKLAPGQTVQILGHTGSWYKIKKGNMVGYVYDGYLKEDGKKDTGSSGGSDSKDNISDGNGIVTASALNVRSGPGTGYARKRLLPKNTKVKILAKSGDWYKIECGNLVGYVHCKYIKMTDGSSNNRGNEPVRKGVVTAKALNIRTGPSTSHAKIGLLFNGNKIDILSSVSGWYKIKTSTGRTGYVFSNYVK